MVQQHGFPRGCPEASALKAHDAILKPAPLGLCRASTDPLPQMLQPAEADQQLRSSLSAPVRLEQVKDAQPCDVHTLLESLHAREIGESFDAGHLSLQQVDDAMHGFTGIALAQPWPTLLFGQPTPKAATWAMPPAHADAALFAQFEKQPVSLEKAVSWEVEMNSTLAIAEVAQPMTCDAPSVIGAVPPLEVLTNTTSPEADNQPTETEAHRDHVKGKSKGKAKKFGTGESVSTGKAKGKGKNGKGLDTEKGSAICEKPMRPLPSMLSKPIAEVMLPSRPGASIMALTGMDLVEPGMLVRKSAGCTHAHWAVDARKLKGKDSQVVSSAFLVDLPGCGATPFKIILSATGDLGRRNGAGFRGARGFGHVILKCESQLLPSCGDICFRVGVGRRGSLQPFRGPIERDFSDHSCHGLQASDSEWDFSASIDSTETFVVTLEVASKAAFLADASLWWAALDTVVVRS